MAGKRKSDPEAELWLKRQALQVVMQLPDDPAEALRVLSYARKLVREYLTPPDEELPGDGEERATLKLVR